MGAGLAILALAMIGTDARLGQSVIIIAATSIDYGTGVGDFAYLGVGVSILVACLSSRLPDSMQALASAMALWLSKERCVHQARRCE